MFTLIDQPDDEDETLAALAWEAVCRTILTDTPTVEPTGAIAAAITLRAAIPDLTTFSPNERALLRDWLDRVTGP